MSGRRRRTAGLVRVICTDLYHRDTDEFARRGFHFLCAMKLVPVHTNVAGNSRPFTLRQMSVSPAAIAPVKGSRRVHGEHVYRFECPCGRDEQIGEFKLIDHVIRKFRAACAADPRATRIDLDIVEPLA